MTTFKKVDIVYYTEDGPDMLYEVTDIVGKARVEGSKKLF